MRSHSPKDGFVLPFALALLAILTFWLPVKVTLKNILKDTK